MANVLRPTQDCSRSLCSTYSHKRNWYRCGKLWRTWMIHMQPEWCDPRSTPQHVVIPTLSKAKGRNLLFAYTATDAVWYSSYVPLKSVIL